MIQGGRIYARVELWVWVPYCELLGQHIVSWDLVHASPELDSVLEQLDLLLTDSCFPCSSGSQSVVPRAAKAEPESVLKEPVRRRPIA